MVAGVIDVGAAHRVAGGRDQPAVVGGLCICGRRRNPNLHHAGRVASFCCKRSRLVVRGLRKRPQLANGAFCLGLADSFIHPDVLLPSQQEAGVQAAMKHLRSGKFEEAINSLCDLPIEMARAMVKADRETSFAGAVTYFVAR